jgi:hypothetical protein
MSALRKSFKSCISGEDTCNHQHIFTIHSNPSAPYWQGSSDKIELRTQLRWVIRRPFVPQVLVVPDRSFNGITLSLPAILLSLQQQPLVELEC